MLHQSLPVFPSDDKRWRVVNATMRRQGYATDALIETLHTVQNAFGYIDAVALRFVARELNVPLSKAYGVATFYHAFTLKPEGKHRCVICQGTACYIKGAHPLLRAIKETFAIAPGETTEDGEISLLSARCLGACSLAPAAIMDDEVVGKLTPEIVLNTLREWVKP
jgi:bidirectional [NiFe] hydrogenase diaphorase subunit